MNKHVVTIVMILIVLSVGVYVLEKLDVHDMLCSSINASVDITSDTCGIRGKCPPRKCVFYNGTTVDIPVVNTSIAGGKEK